MAKHLYLAVTCKTPGCKTANLLKYMGVDKGDKQQVAALVPTGFTFQCGTCARQYRYEREEVYPIHSETSPPEGWQNSF